MGGEGKGIECEVRGEKQEGEWEGRGWGIIKRWEGTAGGERKFSEERQSTDVVIHVESSTTQKNYVCVWKYGITIERWQQLIKHIICRALNR